MERHALESARLRLEPTTAQHAAVVYRHVTDPRLWTFFPDLRPRSLDALELLYKRWERGNPGIDGDSVWENWVCFLRDTDTPVGSMQATIYPNGEAAIAYMFYVAHHGKGYAREAARCVVEHLHAGHATTRVVAEMNVRNARSIRLAESLGFRRAHERAGEYTYEYEF